MTDSSGAAGSGPGPAPARRRWPALAVMLLAAVMDLLDVTIVNVAVPSIQDDFRAGAAAVEWILAGYTLSFGLLLIAGGRLGDTYGRKRLFLAGVVGFTAASLLCGCAGSVEVLVAARVAQGVFAALMVPQILSVIQVSFTPAERPKAYALYGAAVAVATVSGPLIGGALVEADLFGLGWRAIFLINLPVGVLTLVAGALLLDESRAERVAGVDWPGVALVGAALLLLLYPLTEGQQASLPAWTFVSMAAAVPLLVLFARRQRAQDAAGSAPLVPVKLLTQRTFVAGMAAQFAVYAGVSGAFLVLTIAFQAGHGFSALHTGLALLPWSVGVGLSGGAAGPLAARLGRRLPMAGSVLMAAGMGAVLAAVQAQDGTLAAWPLVPGLLVAGIGMGVVAPTIIDVTLAGVPAGDAGSASGIVTTCGQLGSSFGVAVIGAVFFGSLPDGRPADPTDAFSSALSAALWCEIAAFTLTAALMLLLPRHSPAAGSGADAAVLRGRSAPDGAPR
jgi:EmrB/QacA subfamily drug resistance transporter